MQFVGDTLDHIMSENGHILHCNISC